MSVVDNPYEETNIQLVGEGYEDDFTLENIHGLVADSKENTEGYMEEDVIEGKRGEWLRPCMIIGVLYITRPELPPTGPGGL